MKNVLVATDFSVNADAASHYSAQIASMAKAEVTIMHVCELFEEKLSKYKSEIKGS